jgi:hypothetical protein
MTGALDTTFGASGMVTVDLTGTDFVAPGGLAFQGDGKIVAEVVSDVYAKGSDGGYLPEQVNVARFSKDGILDTTFGGGDSGVPGVVRDIFSSDQQYRWGGIAVQPSGGIVALAAYRANGTGNEQAVLVRLHP